jgi:long-chain acyl-CoA synthetase
MKGSAVHGVSATAHATPAAWAIKWRALRWSYGELENAAALVRGALLARGIAPGARVALLMRNSPQYLAAYLGVLGAGAVAVPLNTLEHAAMLARQIDHCGATLALGDADHPEWPALARSLSASGLATVGLAASDAAGAIDQLRADLGAPQPAALAELEPESMASIIYTSGTTGRPKGVTLTHANLAANTAAIIAYLGLSSADRSLCVLPFHYSYGNSVLHTHLAVGAEIVLEDNLAFPHATLQRLQDEAVSGFAGVPSTFALLLGRCKFEKYDLSHLRYVTQAGGAMPRALILQLRALLPRVQLFIMYGQTEATARLTYLAPAELERRVGSVGVPVDGVEIDIRQDGRSLPAGTTGEICARGASIMRGYWKDAALTDEVLREGWLHTGDLGHRDADGFLYIDGRAAEMIKVGAFRVAPQEIEEVIAELPGVLDVGVTSMPDEMLGQAPLAVVVARPDADLDARAVRAHCRAKLAAYKVPRQVEFASTLPRTSTGKLQRLKLSEKV